MSQYLYKKSKEHENKKRRRMIAVCLMLSMMAGLLTGCGDNSPAASSGEQGADVLESDVSGAQTGQEDAENTGNDNKAMGRYVENSVDISEYTTLSCGITALSDGRFLVLDKEAGMLVSEDGGVTWQVEAVPGISDLAAFTKENYIFTMKADTDGTVAVLSSPNTDGDGDFHTPVLYKK